MIFKQITELKDGSKTETRRIKKLNEWLVTLDDGTKRIMSKSKSGRIAAKADSTTGRDYPITPKYLAPALTTHRFKLLDIWEEPLHDLTIGGAIAEGIKSPAFFGYDNSPPIYWDYLTDDYVHLSAIDSYASLWDMINGKSRKYRWDANPTVWGRRFEVFEVEAVTS